MSYSDYDNTEYTYYDEREEELIEKWLTKKGYTFWRPTVCGNCCGMYENFYAINGIIGHWKHDKDIQSFIRFAKKNDIPYSHSLLIHDEINPDTNKEW